MSAKILGRMLMEAKKGVSFYASRMSEVRASMHLKVEGGEDICEKKRSVFYFRKHSRVGRMLASSEAVVRPSCDN